MHPRKRRIRVNLYNLGSVRIFDYSNAKRDTTGRRYDRAGSLQLLAELLELAEAVEEQSEAARCAYMHNRIGYTLDSWKNFWKEMRNLGLIPKTSESLHCFMPKELNNHLSIDIYYSIAISSAQGSYSALFFSLSLYFFNSLFFSLFSEIPLYSLFY